MTGADLEKLLADATPGEWFIPTQPNKVCIAGYTSNGHAKVVATANEPSWMGLGEPYANADLIALAPTLARRVIAAEKLADALRGLVDWPLSGPEPTRLWDDARAALAAWEAAHDPRRPRHYRRSGTTPRG